MNAIFSRTKASCFSAAIFHKKITFNKAAIASLKNGVNIFCHEIMMLRFLETSACQFLSRMKVFFFKRYSNKIPETGQNLSEKKILAHVKRVLLIKAY